MSKNLIKRGDIVVFAQQYLPSEPSHKLYKHICKVKSLVNNDQYAMVEFNHQPGREVKIFIEDLEHYISNLDEAHDDNIISFEDISNAEDHEFGGMSRAQLIAHKLYAQEYDPAMDKSINSLIN